MTADTTQGSSAFERAVKLFRSAYNVNKKENPKEERETIEETLMHTFNSIDGQLTISDFTESVYFDCINHKRGGKVFSTDNARKAMLYLGLV